MPEERQHLDDPTRLQRVRVAIELQIPSDVRYIEDVVELVRIQCERLGFAPRQVALNVPVAVTEALSNAILYGNRQNPDKRVWVRVEVDSERLVLEVADEGIGFDLDESTVDPTRPENILREDGRGLYLMQCLMDTVEQVDNRGSVVRLTLRRA